MSDKSNNTIIKFFLWLLYPFIILYNMIFGNSNVYKENNIDINEIIRIGGFKKAKSYRLHKE